MHDFPPPQPQPRRTVAARSGPVRLAPLQGETNLSYLDRLADRYRLGVRDLVPALLQVGGGLFKGYRTDGEVYLNAEARARISAFSRVPEEILQRALPAWTAQEPLAPDGAGSAGRFRFEGVVPAAGEGRRLCTAARTRQAKPAQVYLQPHTRICPRHRRWMLGTHWIDGTPAGTEQVDLAGLPELLAAHRRHLDLPRHRPDAAKAFEVAHAVVVSWWAQQWPEEEQWPRRALRLVPPGADPGWWRLLARDAVTYPETVALTSVLTGERTGERLLADTGGHLPQRRQAVRRCIWGFGTPPTMPSPPVWHMPAPTPPSTATSPRRSTAGSTALLWAGGCRTTGNFPRCHPNTSRNSRHWIRGGDHRGR